MVHIIQIRLLINCNIYKILIEAKSNIYEQKMLRINQLVNKGLMLSKILTVQTQYLIHHDGLDLPIQFNHKYEPWQKALLYSKQRKLVPKVQRQYQDILFIPGYDEKQIGQLYLEYIERKVPLSPENVCVLLHSFIEYKIMTTEMFDLIQPQAYRHKGQYKTRSIFGGLRAAIIYSRKNLMDFFIEEYQAAHEKFTLNQMTQILNVLSRSQNFTRKDRKQFWETYFRQDFLDGFKYIKRIQPSFIRTFFYAFKKLEEKDQQLWAKFIQMMKKCKGWARIPAAETLYALSGENQAAKQAFDKLFQELSQNPYITSRYNLTEMRYYTPLQMIKNLEQNPVDYYPKIRTLVPEDESAQEWNQKYQQFLKVGAVKEEEQIIKDKSKSFGYAIRERYQTLKADNLNFSEMHKQQFESLFGDYEQIVSTIKVQDQKADEAEKRKLEQQEKANRQDKKAKGDKKDGQQKQKDKGKGKQKEKQKADKPKQKKQKAPSQQK